MGRKKKIVEITDPQSVNATTNESEVKGEVITNDNALKVIAESLFVLTQLQHTVVNDGQAFKKAHEINIKSLSEAHNILHQKITAIEEAFLKFQSMFSRPATASVTISPEQLKKQMQNPDQPLGTIITTNPPKTEPPAAPAASTSNGFGL